MKMINSKKVLLAGAVATALTGCGGSDDFTPEPQANLNAPTHGGDIQVSFFEKDDFTFVDLLGTPEGRSAGDGVATDADGNYLSVKNVSYNMSGPRVDDIMDLGIELNGNQLGVRPLAIAPLLDTDETHTVTVSYEISDGQNSIPRMATIVVTGEDFAPEATGDMVGNFTRDAGTGAVDLLLNVVDADGEPLSVGNLVPSDDNPMDLPVTFNGTTLEVNVAAVENDIPDGQKVEFNYTYDISDHRFTITRNLQINILGVQDVPGAPLVLNYFKQSEMLETDTVLELDLSDEIQEREGDPIVISEVMVDGEALPYGYSIDGNMLSIDPHAFFNETPKDGFISHQVTYRVSDDQGNMSDGTPELTVIINGEETNIISGAMTNPDFENPALAGDIVAGGNLGGFSRFGWATWWCATPTIGTEFARTGTYGMRFEGRYCDLVIDNIIDSLPNDQKYAFSYGLMNKLESTNPASNPYVPIFATVPEGSELDNRFWVGPRYFDLSVDKWMEHVQIVSTFDGGSWDGYEGSAIHWDIMKYADADGIHYLDDFSVVAFGHYDKVAHDMLVDDIGAFEAGETITSSGGGIAEIRDVEGENKLFVDTTGAADGVTITLPVQAGAIKQGGRFALVVEAQLANHDALYSDATDTTFYASLSNGSELITASLEGATVGAGITESDIIISEDFGRSADVDWSQEAMVVNILLNHADAQYYIDNVRLIALP
ncbi:hypothetical protein [Alteromonas sp. KUL49]|uniref:hypothetical protein n=1 Tax=Alteromonas sp. KUL49 TaxID=2480798 RepID=UPI00102F0565|nr:hypothetical protein [Alteromonas sp. KUL49]TAP40121.1 hypothetical protein EYS00_08030 [Alteromonas sp. KUL49]GEA11234.1 hypothetical protein KUL49_16090 [Alteromonas sp. KUL49]